MSLLTRRGALIAFGVYLAASVILFGRPILAHPSRDCLCIVTTHDEGPTAWAMAWWPYALLHGLNPFFSKLIYVPQGIDIAQGALMPGLLVMAPVTALASPLFSFNLAALLAPVLASFFTFLLCRRVTRSFWPSLIGGWVFGFSTYMLGQETGHLNLTMVFCVPALVHLGLRLHAGELRGRRGTALIALALIGQFSLSDEIFATFTIFAAVTLALAYALGDGEQRTRVRDMLRPIGFAYLVTIVIVSPYVWYALKSGGTPVLRSRTDETSADLLGFVLPTQITRLLGVHFLHTTERFTAGYVEGGEYLGLPLIALLVLAVWQGRRRLEIRLLAAVLVIALICALGPHLHVRGHSVLPLPWDAIERLPLLGLVLPSRIVMYATLAAGVLVAITLARSHDRGHAVSAWVLAAAAVVSLWPAVNLPFWYSKPDLPTLFSTSAYKRVIAPRDTVLVIPSGSYGNGMLWQAEAGLSAFKMAGGYVLPPQAPDPYGADPIFPTLNFDLPVAHPEQAAAQFVAAHHVTVAVMSMRGIQLSPWPRILGGLGWSARVDDGALIMRP